MVSYRVAAGLTMYHLDAPSMPEGDREGRYSEIDAAGEELHKRLCRTRSVPCLQIRLRESRHLGCAWR